MSASREIEGRKFRAEVLGVMTNPDSRLIASRMALETISGIKWHGSGSFLTESHKPTEYPGGSLLHKMRTLRKRPVNIDRRIVDKDKIPKGMKGNVTLDMITKLGAIRLDKLSALSYAFHKIWQILWPNEDYSVNDISGDQNENIHNIASIFAFEQAVKGGDKKNCVVGVRQYFDKPFQIINVWNQSTGHDGSNFLVFPSDHVNDYREMISVRSQAQTGLVVVGLGGNVVDGNSENISNMIEMVGQPKYIGEWLMHSARTIRMMVMHGLPVSQLNVDSFVEKLQNLGDYEQSEKINLEAVVQVVGNLLVADVHNQKATSQLIKSLGLNKYLGKAKTSEIREGMEVSELQLWGESNPTIGRRNGKFQSIVDLSKRVAKFMIVSSDTFYSLVPDPDKRGRVEAVFVSNDGAKGCRDICKNTIPAVEKALQMAERERTNADELVQLNELINYLYREAGLEREFADVLASGW